MKEGTVAPAPDAGIQDKLAHRRAYSIREAAELLGVHKVSVYRRIYTGEIKVLSGFGRIMVPATELDRFLGRVEVYTPRKRKRST